MVRVTSFKSLKCWFARGHAWEELGRANHWRCKRCGRRAFSYFWDWKGGEIDSDREGQGGGKGRDGLPW